MVNIEANDQSISYRPSWIAQAHDKKSQLLACVIKMQKLYVSP